MCVLQPKLEDGYEFSVNDKFTSTHTKFKIQTAKATSGERDPAQTRQVVLEDRKHEIDAAVVRIMKARRNAHHNELVTEVITSLTSRFKPDPRDIKKRIEYLIEREFLERSDEDMKTYTYLP
jgi:cullin 3